MRLLNTNDIENWANTVDCKYHLPHVLRKLILATVDNEAIKSICFPYGEDVQTGGFDGELATETQNMFVPLGESVWEFGTTTAKGKKANEDYEKRKQNPLGKNPSDTTYINVNAKKYRDKNQWVIEKKSEGFWKDVKYYDAVDIEQWLELAPTVELWLAEKLRKPTLGIYTIEEYWKQWSENKLVKIVPEILLGESRLKEIETVKSFVTNEEEILYIKSITTDEALAFPLAIFTQFKDEISTEQFVVIDNRQSFNQYVQADNPLVILVKFKIESLDIRAAVQKGHKIIIPINLSEEVNTNSKIQLPIVTRETYELALKEMGVDSEQSRILTKTSGRNISVLKRLLKFDDVTKPKYLDSVSITDIIPMLLVNRFSENCNGDLEIIEKLTGKSSSDYIQFLRILVNLEDSPIYYIDGIWRLVSPTDTWLYYAKYITNQDLETFKILAILVLEEILHKLTLPVEARNDYILKPEYKTKYSSRIREGFCESITVISVFGHDYGLNSIPNVSNFIDQIVQKILEKDVLVWRSLSTNLMLLAEASPNVFLDNLAKKIHNKSITSFFEIENNFLGSSSNDLAPLLWCLDLMAWFPEHLMRVSVALCEIIAISPSNFPTTNTPLSSLKSIYRTWYPQTNTSAENRIKILEILENKYPETLYVLLCSMIESKHDSAIHTPRPKWKLFSELREISVSQREIYYVRGFCIEHIIEMSRNNLDRILSLIKLLDDIEWDKIDIALNAIETAFDFKEEDKKKIYHEFRKIIGNHRSHPDTSWSLPTNILNKMELSALKFKPEDDILNDSYLFEEHYPEFIEGKHESDYAKHDEKISSRRLQFVEAVLNKHGISKIFDLASQIEHPYLYGHILALSDGLSQESKLAIYRFLESEDKSSLALVKSFVRISENRTNLQTQLEVLNNLIKSGLPTKGIVFFLNSLRSRMDLWKYISNFNNKEVEKLYWREQQGFLYTDTIEELLYSLNKLQQFKKPITLLNTLGWGVYNHKNSLTSDEILSILENISFEEFEDISHFDHNRFSNILEFLYSKNDYNIERGAKIEMKFIYVFTGGLHTPKPQSLYKLMSQKPDEYFGMLSQVYLPEDDELREVQLEKIRNDKNYQKINRAAYEVFNSFHYIPSLKDEDFLDAKVLKKWIDEVRTLASENYRTKITDTCLGKLLAKFPINMQEVKGFALEIYDLIEEINTEQIKNGFDTQISNNLSFTSRGAYDGGDIERYRSTFFNTLFEETKYTHPNVSQIFKNLKERYLYQAKSEDEDALLRSLEY
ncbi:hypothetical protein [Flavobacterium sp. GSP14]|uniref:hypothetical protein n=1 Tax=Flavobacterium sp. GSP14 TaxID=3401734 RepID=UPI003AAE214F